MVPTKYKKKFCAEVFKFMSAGLSETQTIAQLGVSRASFYRWKKEYPEFKEACDMGQVKFDAQYEELGVQAMKKEKDIDYQFWRDLMKYRHGWTEKTAPAGTTNNTQININVLNDQSNEELLAYIKTQMDSHPELKTIMKDSALIEHDGSE